MSDIDPKAARKAVQRHLEALDEIERLLPTCDDIEDLRSSCLQLIQLCRCALSEGMKTLTSTDRTLRQAGKLEQQAMQVLALNDQILAGLAEANLVAETAIAVTDPAMKKTRH